MTNSNHPLDRLRHHVSGAIERGEAVAIVGQEARPMPCPRVLTKQQMIDGLKAGHTLYVDRRDAPELPELLAMEADGLVVSKLIEYDEQSSALRFRWKGLSPDETDH